MATPSYAWPIALGYCLFTTDIALAAGELEEVVVTAYRRESSLLETPAAISAFGADTLEALGISNAQDLVTRTPSLSMTGTPTKVSIRGVGRPNNQLGSDPGVAIYVDGIYSTEADLFERANMFDVERIEVLRGPQGTLYGRNAVGGAINVINKGPTAEWHTRLIAEFGNFDYHALQGLVSGPLTDKLEFILAGSTIERSGFQEEVTSGKDLDDKHTDYLRGALQYQWSERFSTRLQLGWSERDRRPSNGYRHLPLDTDYIQTINDIDSGAALNLPGTFPGQNFVNFSQGYTAGNVGARDDSKTQADLIPSEYTETRGIALVNDWRGQNYRIKYLAAWHEYEYDKLVDTDGLVAADSAFDWGELYLGPFPVSLLTGVSTAPPMVSQRTMQEATFQSHDLQLISELDGDLNFVSGLYYYHGEEDQYFHVREDNDDMMAVYRFLGDLVGRNTSSDNWLYQGQAELTTESSAAYGQLQWDIHPSYRLTAGLRYSRDSKRGGDRTFVQWVGDGYISRDSSDNWDSIDWRLGLDYRPTEQHMLYLTAATGYRSGGFNYMKPSASTDVDTVEPEDLLSLELGYKGSLWQDRLHLSANLYHYDYTELQVIRQDVVNGVGVRSFDNAEEAEAWGMELETVAEVSSLLTLGGAWSYNETEYREFYSKDASGCALGPLALGNSQHPLCTEEQDLSGNSFPLTPDHKLSLYATLTWPIGSWFSALTVNYMYVGEQYMDPFNNDRYDLVEAWDRWDAQWSLAGANHPWSVTAWVRNIADERNTVFRERPSTVTHSAGPGVQISEPRVYGLRLAYQF